MDTFENMRMFMRVVETGSFTAAARDVGTTVGNASRAVSDLELRLSTRLLNRTTRRISPTEAGQRYLQQCVHILASVDEAETEAESGLPNPSGKLKIHSVTGFGQHYVVPVISRYRERFPNVQIELTLAQRVPDLIEEGYDVSLVQGVELAECGLLSQRVGSAHSILCASPEYVERHGSPASLAQLQQHACLELRSPLAPQSEWHFDGPDGEESAVPGRIVFSVNLADAMAVALCRGMGVGILPIADALPHLRAGKLVHLLPEYSSQQVQYFAIYPPRHSFNTRLKTWIQFLREQLPNLTVARHAWTEDLPS